MKTPILYALLALATASAAAEGIALTRNNATLKEREKTIREQRVMIERLSQQEAIAIHITNEFRSNAVLGKVVVDANIKNAAEQCAAILKGELVKPVEKTVEK